MIRLVRAETCLLDAALQGDDALENALGIAVVPGWVTFSQALQSARETTAADQGALRWGTRFFLTEDPPELVGWGGFKGPPKEGVVELGYERAARSRSCSARRSMRRGRTAAVSAPRWCRRYARMSCKKTTRFPIGPRIRGLPVKQPRGGRGENRPLEESPDTAGQGGRGTDPAKAAGKCHRKHTADGAASAESRTGKGEKVR
jgi:hypothetical protein